jgi:hypothetical protein
MGRHLLRLPCLFCLLCVFILCALLLLVFSTASSGLAFAAQPAGQQTGDGGAPLTRGLILPPAPGATPTAQARGVIYGGRGPGGNCSNPVGGGAIATIVQQDFHWGSARLNPRYQRDSVDRLCNDFWAWFDPAGQDVPARQVLQILRWPPDLFAQPWRAGLVHVSWMPIAFPATPTPVCPGSQNCGAPNENPACYWSPQVGPFQPTFNLCAPIRAVINAVAGAIGQGYRDSAAQLTFLWSTPLSPFQDDAGSGLLSLWNLSWRLVLLATAAVIAWGALRSMIGSVVNWLSYAQIIELLPRLLFALLAALLSRQVFVLLIQVNNALSVIFSNSLFQTIITHPNPGIRLGLLQILYGLLGLALIVEGAARLALIEALFAASPLLFFLAALPETQRWAQTCAVAAVLFVFLQAVQAFLLDVGDHLLGGVLHVQSGSLNVLQLLVALAILYLTLTLFVALLRAAFGPGGYALAGFPLLTLTVLRRASRSARSSLTTLGGRAGSAASRPGFTSARSLIRGQVWNGSAGDRSGGRPANRLGGGRPLRAGAAPTPTSGSRREAGQRSRHQRLERSPASRRAGAAPSSAMPRSTLTPPARSAAPVRSFVHPLNSPTAASGEGPQAQAPDVAVPPTSTEAGDVLDSPDAQMQPEDRG